MPRLSLKLVVPVAVAVLAGTGGVLAIEFPGSHSPRPAAAPVGPSTASTSTTSPDGLAPLAPGWLKAENSKPGASDWRLTDPSRNGTIEGYAGAVSVARARPVSLYISSTASTYTVRAYRMGYYGGLGARLVWTSSPQSGLVQPPPTVTPRTNTVECAWSASLTVPIDASWLPGDYLFKLVADNGQQSYIPLTIRDDESTTDLLIQNSVTTWQAYNLWGGYDLYEGRSGSGSSFANRARIVSFDRPYKIGDGSGDFLGEEFNFVSLVESLGNDVSYTTDVDVDLHPERLLRHHAFISLGHDEYWSLAMRDGVEAARDQGVNLAFLGANAVFRHIRFASSPLGPDRHEIDYKSAREDPLYGIDNADVTPNSWREPPNNRPENTLLGELYQCNPVQAALVVTEPGAWVFEGAGLAAGRRLANVVGSEYDGFVPGLKGPGNVEIFAHSPLRCRNAAGYSDFTYYTAPSGAGVIDVGTNQWVPRLVDPVVAAPLTTITENILRVFSAGPAGPAHPSKANYASLPKASVPRPNATVPAPDTPIRPTTSTTHPSTPTSTQTTAHPTSTAPAATATTAPASTTAPPRPASSP